MNVTDETNHQRFARDALIDRCLSAQEKNFAPGIRGQLRCGRAQSRRVVAKYLPAWSSSAETATTWCDQGFVPTLDDPGEPGTMVRRRPWASTSGVGVSPATFPGPSATQSVNSLTVTGSPSASSGRPLGLDPEHGYIEIRARGIVTHRSMVGFLAGRY